MALKGKTIRIKGDDYTVDEQFIDFENHEEVIILKRPTILKADKPDDVLDRPATIFDLGYSKPSDIIFNEERQLAKKAELDSKIGCEIILAMVEPSGLIKQVTAKFLGPLMSSPELCKLEFKDGIQHMKIDFLITASLLSDDYLSELDKYIKKLNKRVQDQDPQKKVYQDILDEFDHSELPEELNEILEVFGDFFTRRFNERR